MTTEAKIRVSSTGLDQLAGGFGKAERSAARLGKTGQRVSAGLTRNISGLTGKIGGLRTMLAGVVSVAKAKDILDFDDRMGKLQAKAKMTTTEARNLRDKLLALGPAFGVGKDEAADMADVFQDFGGLLKEGTQDFDLLAKVSKGTGAAMKDLATIDAVLIKQGMSYDERVKAFAKLTAQADAATVALEGVASVYPQLASIGATQGFRGVRGIEQIGTALQVAGEAYSGRPEESRTGVIALLRDLTAKRGKLAGMGISVFDKKGNMRDLDIIMAQVIKKTKGQAPKLAKIFTRHSMTIAGAWAEAIRGGRIGTIQKASAAAGAGTIEEGFQKRLAGVGSEAEKVKRGLAQLDTALQKAGGTVLGFLLSDPKKTAMAAGGAYGGYKLLSMLARLGLGGWGKTGGGGAAGLVGRATGVTPVFVVNMPGATFGQAAGYGLGPGGGAAGAAGKVSKLAAVGRGVAGSIGALALGYGAGTAAVQYTKEDDLFANMATVALRRLGVNKTSGVGMGRSGQTAGIASMAQSLAAAHRAGATEFGKPGSKQALTPENIATALTAQGKQAGLSGDELKNAVAQAIKEAFASQPIVVQTKGGLDRAEVQAGRGAPQ